MMKCLSYKSHQKCPPVTTIGGIYVVDLWISVPETCSNMQKSCLQLISARGHLARPSISSSIKSSQDEQRGIRKHHDAAELDDSVVQCGEDL